MATKIVLFDVMGTLVSEPFLESIPAFFGMSLEQLLVDKHPHGWVDFEHGKISETEYLRNFFRDGRAFDHQAFTAMIRESYQLLPGVEPLLDAIKSAGHPMYALSNYPEWWRLIEEKLQLSRWIEWDFVSCKMGLRKPNPEAYRYVLRNLGVPASQCVFVDDRPVNLKAAAEVGMQVVLREESAAKLWHDLAAAGIDVGAAPSGR
jgi:HAD superfamily hydrolase (TIGR01509 family)